MSDDIAREAAKVRAHDAKATADRKRAAQEAAEYDARIGFRERDARAAVLRDSLGSPLGGLGIGVIVVGVLGALVVSISLVYRDLDPPNVVFAITGVVAMVAIVGLAVFVPRWVARWRLGRLERLGHAFQAYPYRRLLSEKRHTGILVITIGFDHELPGRRRHEIADAVRGWVPELVSAKWHDDALVLRAGELSGSSMDMGDHFGAHRVFYDWSNAPFHRIVMRVARHAIPKLAAAARIVRFEVAIEGKVEAWDA
jgi:hypothetical protein